MSELTHQPVLWREVVRFLDFGNRPARLIDGTLGNGGHSALLLAANPELEILGIDRDAEALERAAKTLDFAAGRVRLRRGNFSQLAEIAGDEGWSEVDGVLLDIGVSSPQLDDPARGFSWRAEGPLDMRMDQRSDLTAARILNRWNEEDLERVFREYGEIRKSRKLARTVCEIRKTKLFGNTLDLVAACDLALGRSRPGELPSPTLAFQALRIAVNDELGELATALDAALAILKPGGKLAVISFHSLEDRMVKHYFREAALECVCPPGLPVCVCGKQATVRVLTRKAVTAEDDELATNRRAAPARLRVVEKL